MRVQERKVILTKKVFSLEVCSTSVACIVSVRMVQQVTLQMLGPGESALTSIVLTSKLLALVFAVCILPLTP
jgi:hypothetical protein